ncbi:Lrp/AsnC family transcriptional regulator [Roseibium aestuarii]|uniref:Lrp/AsnC family transcriptional regulator n=1 Tax=Roseibium aestuarii TaxID=2600299 RepID=A0ABW4K2G3_9HYPH|nr:Lrp/AsnC family transcriptional regulator [Roseibium aestuarii]
MQYPDKTDLQILRKLQDNGRLSNADLAQELGLSAATCHRRTQKLMSTGHLKDVRGIVDPQKVDLGTLVIIGIVLDSSAQENLDRFEAAARDIPGLVDCHFVAGDMDYFLKLRVKDMAEFESLHGKRLSVLPGVRLTRTFFVLREVLDNGPLSF